MKTRLLIASTGLEQATIRQKYLPPVVLDKTPGCLEGLVRTDGVAGYQWDLPVEWLAHLEQILPSFSCLAGEYGFQFSLEWRLDPQKDTCITVLDPVGAFGAEVRQERATGHAVEGCIDYFRIAQPLASARLVMALDAPAGYDQGPALLAVSLRSAESVLDQKKAAALPAAVELDVPPKSQMEEDPAVAGHVCSPTSVSMVLDYYGRATRVDQVIDAARHKPSGLYGVWPANLHAASRWGLLGYLLAFPHWNAVRWLLARGVPVIASVRYEAGQLRHAAVERTAGHLLVVRGYGPDGVYVNDPAAATSAQVKRTYDLDEFKRVWLGRGGVGYVLFEKQ